MPIIKKITESLLQEQERRKNRERSGKWNPSKFGRCYRMQYWYRKGEAITNPPDERSLRRFKVGNLFHDFVQGFIPNKNTEVMVKEHDVIGFADIVEDDCVSDIKSQHSRAFHYMERDGYDIKVEKKEMWLQVMYYARRLGKKRGRLIFVSKDDLCMAEYEDFVSRWEEKIQLELDTLRSFWDNSNLPPAEPRAYFDKKKEVYKECDYCMYKDKCKGGEK
ncbi:MAG: hypothetical protein CMI54_03500 [Parcubacteria group bacterium]|nr:hypothetical protein [Parcubacteria group bacterium]